MPTGRSYGDEDRFDPKINKDLKKAILAARKSMIPENYVQRVIQFAQQGYTDIEFKTYDTDWDLKPILLLPGKFKQLDAGKQRLSASCS